MNRMMHIIAALCVVISAAISTTAYADGETRTKALMIMVDGLRADAVENAPMRNLLRLRDGKWMPGYKGASSVTGHTLYDGRPSSPQNHAAIATGVTAAKTGVFEKKDTKNGNFSEWPSWLARIADAKPDKKTLFAYSWIGDTELERNPKVQILQITSVVTNNWPVKGSYEKNAKAMPEILSRTDAPDAILYFIDFTDWGGHRSGFYPYGGEYLHDALLADRIIGDVLDAISSRPDFAHEDWLVMVTSDHGGYGKNHGIWGGQATTIPVVVSGRHIPQGRIAGCPRNYDLAPMALEHFGLDTSKMNLDGKVPTVVDYERRRPLGDGLAVYMDFEASAPVNSVAKGPTPKMHGETKCGVASGAFGKCLRVAADASGACGVSLGGSEGLKFENGAEFAFSLWVRFDDAQMPQAPIVSNKDWSSGRNPGVVLVGARKTEKAKDYGVCFSCGTSDESQRLDMGTFDINYGEWSFYAVTRGSDGVLRIYQGGRDGMLYWIAEDTRSIKFSTGLPFWIGQDGTGKCTAWMKGDVDDFAIWTRSLSHEDVRGIYNAGRRGESISDMNDKATK